MSTAKRSPDFILSAIVAAVVFAAVFLFINLGLAASLLITAVVFAVGLVFLKTKSEAQVEKDSTNRDLLADGREKRRQIADLERRVAKPIVKARIDGILATIDKILATLEENPEKIHDALQFLDYYLGTTVKVLTVYLNLSVKGVHDPEIQKSLGKAEEALDAISAGFETQLARLLSQDATDLGTEIKVLEQNLIGDGLIDSIKSGS